MSKVVTGKIYRLKRGKQRCVILDQDAPPPPEALPPVQLPLPPPAVKGPRVAYMLALAHKVQAALDKGQLKSQREAARRLGLSPMRVTQLLDLCQLAPDIQEKLLAMAEAEAKSAPSEKTLRGIAQMESWAAQREAWAALLARKPEETGAQPGMNGAGGDPG